MTTRYPADTELLRAEIAAAAARMIAQDGVDTGTAKRKAARQVLGDTKIGSDILPDNEQVEEQVRLYNALFLSATQPARLLHLRTLAAQMMEQLQQFTPYLTGAVLRGTAGEHSDIHLDLFADSPKDVEIYLLNRNVDYEASETPHFNKRLASVEIVSFIWQKEGVHLTLYQQDDLRGALRKKTTDQIERANLAEVHALIRESKVR